MILGIGVDICQNNRINVELSQRILNELEFEFYNNLKLDARKTEYLSGRFACKEAIIKAFSQADKEVYMRDIIILNDDLNRPQLIKPNFTNLKVSISLSHEKDYSIGFAIVESLD
ncbi:MAG: holo-ACP synthase [Candidatus Izemoplasmatales bacterium]|jgi:holo-[acyl-carrier protein] synthase